MRFVVPRFITLLVTCVGIALTAAGCDPVTDRNYMDEGAGIGLYTANGAAQTDLQNQYFSYICQQAGLATCGYQAFNARDWRSILDAGMNDIDQRCDGYLTWLDARRRDKEPVLAELAAMTAAASSIMTATGASVKALNIVTTAFGLAAISYTQWNSRLLISVEQSTVQNVVYNFQGLYRTKITDYVVADRPTTIYLLRNYLRLCTPIVIEANINTSTSLVSFDIKPPASSNLVINTVHPPASSPPVRIRASFNPGDAGVALTSWIRRNGGTNQQASLTTIRQFFVEKKYDPVPQVTEFLNGDKFAADRIELARRLNLIQ